MKVTLDVNVLISGTFWTGDSFRILETIDKKELLFVTSKAIIDEYEKILKSDEIVEKVKDKQLVLKKIAQKIITNSLVVKPKRKLDVVKDDPDDNKILECATESKVDYIITQDKHLLKIKNFEGIKILKPSEFLEIYLKYKGNC